jgi:hypothetical protein
MENVTEGFIATGRVVSQGNAPNVQLKEEISRNLVMKTPPVLRVLCVRQTVRKLSVYQVASSSIPISLEASLVTKAVKLNLTLGCDTSSPIKEETSLRLLSQVI